MGTYSIESIKALEKKSIVHRRLLLNMIVNANAGHTGGSLSCVDLLNVLYNHVMDIRPDNFSDIDRDHYIHSKGHSVEALYAVLGERGFYDIEELERVEQYDSDFIGHPTRKVPGIEQNTGALGHGLSVAVGMALAAKKDGRKNRVFTIMGDGELTEGSIWEAAASASHYHLDNLVAIIDRNTLQISGNTEDVMAMEPIEDKFKAFGFAIRMVDGHDFSEMIKVFKEIPYENRKPNLVIAKTIKGKGVSFIEDKVEWHHHVPSKEEFKVAIAELDHAEKALGEAIVYE